MFIFMFVILLFILFIVVVVGNVYEFFIESWIGFMFGFNVIIGDLLFLVGFVILFYM